MSDYYRDCVLSRDGTRVLTVTRTVETGMHVRISPDGDLVWRDFQDIGYVNGIALGHVMGNFPLAFTSRRTVLRQFDTGGFLAEHDLDGRLHTLVVPAEYRSEGIAAVVE